MPTPCDHYKHLNQRLEQLRTKFLQDELYKEAQDPLTFDADLDQIAAFKLLFHAEVEMFLEEKAKERVSQIECALLSNSSWQRNNPHIFAMEHLLCCGDSLPSEYSETNLAARLKALLEKARKKIKDNNGVKEASFVALSVLSGKTSDEISSTIAATLNSFGAERGEIAHTSVPRTRVVSGPSVENVNASEIVRELGVYFDVS